MYGVPAAWNDRPDNPFAHSTVGAVASNQVLYSCSMYVRSKTSSIRSTEYLLLILLLLLLLLLLLVVRTAASTWAKMAVGV